ncbi:MAG: Ig-like domain-containing protein [Neisseriaceae bacterium]
MMSLINNVKYQLEVPHKFLFIIFLILFFLSGCGNGGSSNYVATSINITKGMDSISIESNISILQNRLSQISLTNESSEVISSIFIGNKDMNAYESITIPKGFSENIYPYAKYSDGHIEHLPSGAYMWFTSGQVSIDTSGILTANVIGRGTLTLSYQNHILSTSIPVEVSNATIKSLVINPSGDIRLPLGKTIQLHAVATFSDNSTDIISNVDWNSESNLVASIDDTGIVTGNKLGIVNVNAIYGNISATKKIEIEKAQLQNISISIESTILVSGTNNNLVSATGYYSDNSHSNVTSMVTWLYNPLLIKQVDSNGHISVAPGVLESTITTIMATSLPEISSNLVTINIIPLSMIDLDFDTRSSSNQCNHWISEKVTKCLLMLNAYYNDGSYIEDFVDFPVSEIYNILSKTIPTPKNIIINNHPTNRNIELVFNSLTIESVNAVVDYNGFIRSKLINLK